MAEAKPASTRGILRTTTRYCSKSGKNPILNIWHAQQNFWAREILVEKHGWVARRTRHDVSRCSDLSADGVHFSGAGPPDYDCPHCHMLASPTRFCMPLDFKGVCEDAYQPKGRSKKVNATWRYVGFPSSSYARILFAVPISLSLRAVRASATSKSPDPECP